MASKRGGTVPPLVYIDSCVYLDLIIKNDKEFHAVTGEPRWQSAKVVFDAVATGKVRLAASALTEAEVCCNGDTRRRQASSDKVRDLMRFWFLNADTRWTDIDRFLARDAAAIAAEFHDKSADRKKRFRSADALHMAAAVRLGCQFLMTHDGGFPIGNKVRDTQIIRPEPVWDPDLFEES